MPVFIYRKSVYLKKAPHFSLSPESLQSVSWMIGAFSFQCSCTWPSVVLHVSNQGAHWDATHLNKQTNSLIWVQFETFLCYIKSYGGSICLFPLYLNDESLIAPLKSSWSVNVIIKPWTSWQTSWAEYLWQAIPCQTAPWSHTRQGTWSEGK